MVPSNQRQFGARARDGSAAMTQTLAEHARRIFETDREFARDREKYGTFDRMPLSLQNWWMARAYALLHPITDVSDLQPWTAHPAPGATEGT
jgi:hypothetical protein